MTLISLRREIEAINIGGCSGEIYSHGTTLLSRLKALLSHDPTTAEPRLYETILKEISQMQFSFATMVADTKTYGRNRSSEELSIFAAKVVTFYKSPQPSRAQISPPGWGIEALSA